ncbi:GPI-anchored surface protein, putative [Bodo saltans]|uniref:GPI-anchored surface protein, putative n=1 Tax=Bodo saltans TaxID=75058 RepID=A0A0S4JVH4_BODSA|nr:GPI-anchored surface protein, putative [Bodo saltans]|eukprot:CUG92578.1 GPI-anchored surface protein, putative [Bodo saltans]
MACPIANASGLPCNGNGTCFDGVCYCVPSACGADCSVNKTEDPSQCSACPYPSQYGFNCAFTCPGSPNIMDVCTGHGTCDNGPLGLGTCLCADGYGGPACSTACPAGASGSMCSGHGVCDRGTGTCLCNRTYGGSACGSACPFVNGVLCGPYGTCDEGSSNTGKCICNSGYFGPACNVSCFTQQPPCSGHGVCQSSGLCSCFTAMSTGYWAGSDSCSTCSSGWVGSSCNLQCAKGPNGLPCSGRGFCNNLLQCQCYASSDTGFWGDDVCGTCAYGYSGANCSTPCDGGACAPCNLNGICNSTNGKCMCFNDTTRGFWNTSTACNTCLSQYYGSGCQGRCIGCGQGVCLDGQYGNGTCACNAGFATNGSGVCNICAQGFYGAQCRPCSTCNNKGSCLDGLTRNGSCVCNSGFAGANCTFQCNISTIDGQLCGNGTCTANRTCTCRTNFTLDANMTCSACKSGLYGDACNLTCPACARGTCRRNGTCACPTGYFGTLCDRVCPGGVATPCSLHGVCHPLSGLCACSNDTTAGYYTGTTCSSCQPSYLSTNCNIACPSGSDGSGVCSGRGTCFNGACTGCTPRRNETTTVFLLCGASCNVTNEGCLSFGFVCPLGFYSPPCNATCPGNIMANGTVTATCSSHGICSPVNGTCFCFAGYFGPSCNLSCPAGFDADVNATVPCSGNGVCSSIGACQCVRGYLGTACQSECPGGAANPCSNRGVCNADGTCTCSYGALGASCANSCPGGFTTPCNGRGTCASDTGLCVCQSSLATGFWTGANCTMCAPNYGGVGCNIPCPSDRGAVISGQCACLPSFTGNDCSLPCPIPSAGQMGAGLVCSGNGACSATFSAAANATVATCACNVNYYGPYCQTLCTVALCKISNASLLRPQCNTNTGTCECETSPGIWVGSTCSVCAVSRWGTECNQQCFCNGNGVCDDTNGQCRCYGDSNNGFWTGTYCDSCQSGYVGAQCRTANIAFASQGSGTSLSAQVQNISAFLSAPSWCSFLDISSLTLWTAGDETTITLMSLSTSSEAGSIDVGGIAIECALFDSTRVAVTVLQSDMVTESLVLVGLTSPHTVQAVSRRFTAQATAPVLLKQVSSNGFTCSLFGNQTTRLLSVATCTLANTSVVTITINPPILPSWSSIILLDNTPDLNNRWQLVLASASGMVWMWNLAKNISTTADSSLVGDGQVVTGDPVAIGMCSTNAQDIDALYCSGTLPNVADSALIDVVLVGLSVATHVIQSVSRLEIGLSASTALTALTVDPTFGLALVAYNLPNSASTILTMRVVSWNNTHNGAPDVTVIGVQDLPLFQVALSLTVEAAGRTLLIVGMRFSSVTVLRYNLFGVLSVSPQIVDANGGALLYISGEGFPVNTSVNTLCITGGVASVATVLNESVLTCVVKAAGPNSGGMCDVEYVNVMLGNTSSDTKTVGVRRPVPAILSSVFTDAGTVGYGPASAAIGLTIVGFGFVNSPAATCRVVNQTTRAEITRSGATVVNSSAALCRQQVAPPSAVATCLEYSHDGYYFGTSCAPYQIVGDFGGVDIKLGTPTNTASQVSALGSTLTVSAAAVTKLPNFFVASQDHFGNPRGPFEDMTNLQVRCSTLIPSLAITNRVPEELTFTANTSLTLVVMAGVANFGKTFVSKPPAGTYTFYCFPTVDSTMFSVMNITITPGVPAFSSIQPSASWFVGVTKSNVLLPNPQLVLLDTAGNIIMNATLLPATLQYQILDPHTELFLTQKFVSIARSDGVYVFENIPMQSLFGIDTPLTFFVNGVPQTVQSIKQEVCLSPTEYSIRGTTTCAVCPDSGICDGTTLVQVRAGYWRPSIDSYSFYACTPEDACPTNAATGCAAGYQSTMCSQCADGYGWSVNHCAECSNHHINRLLMAILLFAFVAIVFYMSIGTMPITSIYDTMYLAALQQKSPISVIVKLLVSHFQVVALIPFSSLNLPDWFREFFLIARSGSSVNPNLSFISCEIGDGLVASIVLSIALCPIMIGILGLLALAAAKWTAYRFTKSAFDTVFVEQGITEHHNTARVAEFVAQGNQEHLEHVHRSHLQFFGEGGAKADGDEEMLEITAGSPVSAWDGGASFVYGKSPPPPPTPAFGEAATLNQVSDLQRDVVGESSRVTFEPNTDVSTRRRSSVAKRGDVDFSKMSEDARAAEEAERERKEATRTLQSKKDKINRAPKTFLVRWINMVALATIVILFVLLPSIIEFSAEMLQCTNLDYGHGDSRSVVTAEPSMSCSDSHYSATTKWVWVVIVGFGIGVPAANVLLVKALTRWTCNGNQFIAQDIFFFATGGYNRKMWYWESVSLARKAILVLGATLLSETRLQVLWCVWFLLLSVAMNITFRPWASSLLSNVELFSLSSLALTFGIAEILLLIDDNADNSGSRSTMVISVIIVNAIAVAVFIISGLWFLKDLSMELAQQGNNIFTDVFDDKREAIKKRRKDIRWYLSQLGGIHRRFCVLSELELFVDRVGTEAVEHAKNVSNFAEYTGANDDDDRSRSDALRVMQGGVYKAQKYRQRRDATPQVVERYATKNNLERSSFISKLLTSSSSVRSLKTGSGVTDSLAAPTATPPLNPLQQPSIFGTPAQSSLHADPSAAASAGGGGAAAGGGMEAFCGIVADILRRTNQPTTTSNLAEDHPMDGSGMAPAVVRGGPLDALEFKHVHVAFEDLWEMWAYWTSIAESCIKDPDPRVTALVEDRMLELFAIEESLLKAIALLCEKVRLDQEN